MADAVHPGGAPHPRGDEHRARQAPGRAVAERRRRDKRWLEASRQSLNTLGRLASIEVLAADAEAPESATALVGEMKVLIPMAGLIDKEAELTRLEKELDKLTNELQKCENKLANKNFVERAPAAVVEKEKKRADEQRKAIVQLNEQLEKIRGL